MGNYNSSQLCPNPECGLYIPHPVGSCARLRQEHEAGQASSFRHPYPRRPHSSYAGEEASQSACNSPSVVTRESVHHHALAGSSSVTSSPYRFRHKPGTTSQTAASGYQQQQQYPHRPRASTTGSAGVEASSATSPEDVDDVDVDGILSPVSGDSLEADAEDAIDKRDPGSSSYVSYHASRGKSICSPRKGIRPSGSSHSLFEDAVELCQKDEEDLAEANEKRGIVTRGEYFSSSRYSSRRSSAVTTPGEPEEGFCRLGASPRRNFRPANQNQRSLDGCDIFAAIQALNELKEAGEVDQVHEWVNEQGRLQRRLKKARPGAGIVGPSGEEFCGLATVGEEAKVGEGAYSSSSSNLADEKDSLLLPSRLTPFDSSSGEVRPAGLETDEDVGVILPTDAVELQQSNSSRAMIQSETSSTICRNNTDTTLVGADSPDPPRHDDAEGKGGGAATLFSLENDSSGHSDEEPMDCMDTLSMEIRPGETGVVDMSRLPDKGLSSGEPLFPSHAPFSQSPNLFISGGGPSDLFPSQSHASFPQSVATACGSSNDESSPMMDTSSASSHHSPTMIS